ncbi:MAG: polysaccharide deacetylase family protein [Rhizomicrobium sp.]
MKICLKLHGLGAPPKDAVSDERSFWTGEERFARILALAGKAPERIHLTFDDGNKSDARIALPALMDAGLKASFFFSTDFIGTPGYANEDDIRALAAAGMEIGSHGCHHTSWLSLSGDEINEDVIRSFARLQTILGEAVDVVAAPYGDCDFRVLHILHRLRIRQVYTSLPGPTLRNDWLVRRHCVTSDTTPETIIRWLTRHYGPLDSARAFWNGWRQAGPAALWRTEGTD